MKQIAIIGLGDFGLRVLDELLPTDVEVLVVDKDEAAVALYKNEVAAAYVADAIQEETILKIVPEDIDAAVVDLGGRIEVGILVVNYLKKMGVGRIVANATTDEHGEILKLVGATDVIFPNREAAKRIMPPLLSDSMFSYMPISENLVIAEVSFPPEYTAITVAESGIRAALELNIIAVRTGGEGEFTFISPDYVIGEGDRFLVAGANERVGVLSDVAEDPRRWARLFKLFFNRSDS